MTTAKTKQRTTLTDLPPELVDHITNYLPTASCISNLGRTSKSLHTFVEKDAWKTFSRTRFPTVCPRDTPSYRDTARTLTTLSKAHDKRAFVARYVEPQGDITSFPGGSKVERWKRPRGQTIGFTPHLDVMEEMGSTWQDREETLAFSAGAEVCIRNTRRYDGGEDVRWTTYRPHTAHEGRHDVTALHLVRPDQGGKTDKLNIITGTANGDLQLLHLPQNEFDSADVAVTYFTTQGLPVRSSSLCQDTSETGLLAASLGDTRIALFRVDADQSKICPSTQMDVQPSLRSDGHPPPNHRAWSTSFLSNNTLAVGVGPSESPLHIYSITESGLSQAPLRKFSLQNDLDSLEALKKRSSSAVYITVPLPDASGSHGQVFLSGAFDGIVRLHDLRSHQEVEQSYIDPADDSAIYSILPRGREKFLTGTSRHNLLKVFDMRMGAKSYTYLDASAMNDSATTAAPAKDYNIFLRPNNSFTARGSNWSQGRNRSADSSVYSLASPSAHSPYIYAGVENAIWSLAFTEILDPHSDPVWFEPWSANAESRPDAHPRAFQSKEVQNLAMYDQDANMKLCVQRSMWETYRSSAPRRRAAQGTVDERWKGANEFGP